MAEERKNMEEKKKGFTKWIYYFLLGVAIIVVYKLLDNFIEVYEAVIYLNHCNSIALINQRVKLRH